MMVKNEEEKIMEKGNERSLNVQVWICEVRATLPAWGSVGCGKKRTFGGCRKKG